MNEIVFLAAPVTGSITPTVTVAVVDAGVDGVLMPPPGRITVSLAGSDDPPPPQAASSVVRITTPHRGESARSRAPLNRAAVVIAESSGFDRNDYRFGILRAVPTRSGGVSSVSRHSSQSPRKSGLEAAGREAVPYECDNLQATSGVSPAFPVEPISTFTPEPQMDILIIDDHPLIVQAVTTVIEALAPGKRVAAVDRVEALEDVVASTDPDLVLLDLTLPGISGLEALRVVRAWCPTGRIVIFSAIHDPPTIARALRSGASGFIPKTSPRSVLSHALQLVLDGGIYVPPDILCLIDTGVQDASAVHAAVHDSAVAKVNALMAPIGLTAAEPSTSALANLTERQREIVELLAAGLTTKQISRRLAISSNTVKSHVAVIFRTLGVSNRAQAVAVTGASRRTSEQSTSP
ncbi:response regulator [Quisquiliibacterium transsilvanicum]